MSPHVGIGLRPAHYRELLERPAQAGWLEVHSENYFGDGGYDLHVLETLRARYPISLHGVGLSLGSAAGVCPGHLRKLRRLERRIEPLFVSDHLSWSRTEGYAFGELLPMPMTEEALRVVCRNVSAVQEALGRPILVENISGYFRFAQRDCTEAEFLNALAARTGCGLLVDVNNLFVNECNLGEDANDFLDAIAPGHVSEIHLAGHARTDSGVVDHHGAKVDDEVWNLYARAQERFGQVHTLVEWDNEIPALDVLLGEANKAAAFGSHRIGGAPRAA